MPCIIVYNNNYYNIYYGIFQVSEPIFLIKATERYSFVLFAPQRTPKRANDGIILIFVYNMFSNSFTVNLKFTRMSAIIITEKKRVYSAGGR